MFLEVITQAYSFVSPFLKERLFGLSNPQGNHGESIKEAHFHLDNVPTVSLQSTQSSCHC